MLWMEAVAQPSTSMENGAPAPIGEFVYAKSNPWSRDLGCVWMTAPLAAETAGRGLGLVFHDEFNASNAIGMSGPVEQGHSANAYNDPTTAISMARAT